MLTRTIFFLAAAALLAACATVPRDMPRASAPSHAAGEGLGTPADAAGTAAPAVAPTAPTAASDQHHH